MGYFEFRKKQSDVRVYSRLEVKIFGLKEALFIAQLAYWLDRCNNPLGVHKTSEEWEEEIGLTIKEQERVRSNLKALGVLVIENKPLEHKTYYSINADAYDQLYLESEQYDKKEWKELLKQKIDFGLLVDKKALIGNTKKDSPVTTKSGYGEPQKDVSLYSTKNTTETTSDINSAKALKIPKNQELQLLKNEGVDEQIAVDFIKLRKAKKAPITQTAINRIKSEAAKANVSLNYAIETCVTMGWQGFKADWITKKNSGFMQPVDAKDVHYIENEDGSTFF